MDRSGNLISPESFELFSKRHIKAEDLWPEASYGYGIAVDELDGNACCDIPAAWCHHVVDAIDIAAGIGGFARSTHSRNIARMLS